MKVKKKNKNYLIEIKVNNRFKVLITLERLRLKSSSSVYSLSPFLISGVIYSTMGDFICKEEVDLFIKNLCL